MTGRYVRGGWHGDRPNLAARDHICGSLAPDYCSAGRLGALVGWVT
ncbi:MULTISPECIES: hypothetical protein [unclassified Sulfitobacter]